MTVSSSQAAGGSTNPPGGQESNSGNHSSGDESGGSNGSVSYETHRKLLAEKKRRDEELAQARDMIAKHEKEAKDREERELREKEDWKKLVEIREKELNETKAKAEAIERRLSDAAKRAAFLDAIQGSLDRKYWHMIDTDKIVVDPASGTVDPLSVSKLAEEFRATYPEIIKVKGPGIGMPQGAPQGGSAALSYDEWKALPVAEMKKRLKDVVKSGN